MKDQLSPPTELPDGTPWPTDAVEVAKVLGAWGVKGGIKVAPFSADPQALFGTKRWFVMPPLPTVPGPAQPAAALGSRGSVKPEGLSGPRLLRVTSAREQGDVVVAQVADLQDRDAAEALKGARLFVSRTAFPTPQDNEFYWIDLIGLRVENLDGHALGTVIGLLETGPHCVLRCRPGSQDGSPSGVSDKEILIPFVDAYIQRVSLPDGLIVADWGLDY